MSLSEHEDVNGMLVDKFGVDEATIESQSILVLPSVMRCEGSIIKSKMLILCGIPSHPFHLMLFFSYHFQKL